MGDSLRRCRGLYLACACVLALFILGPGASAKTALQLLQATPAPRFKSGHTLQPLTRWAWPLSYDLNVELAERWGYALDLSLEGDGRQFDNPASDVRRMATLAASDPARYKVSMSVYRPFFDPAFQAAAPEDTWCHDAAGVRLLANGQPVVSPLAPDAVCENSAGQAATLVAKVKAVTGHVDFLMHGGEDAMQVYGNVAGAFEKDPTVLAALGVKSDAAWDTFLSSQKARQVRPTYQQCRAAAGDATPFVYYVTGDMAEGISNFHWQWAWDYRQLNAISSYPSWEFYYTSSLDFPDGKWVWGRNWAMADLLTLALNGAAQGIADGQPLSYSWLCGGWSSNPAKVSSDPLYLGFLKCLYTSGMVGGVAGYFRYPSEGFNGEVGETAPDWLRQIMLLGQAHATFSHLEDYLRHGELLPGDGVNRINAAMPAYELATGSPGARVVARRHFANGSWLLCAWAADGLERDVAVTVPALGALTLHARPEASLYIVRAGSAPMLLDPDGMQPSAALHTITATAGAHGAISPAGETVVPQGGEVACAITPDPGYTVTDVVVDGQSVGACGAYAFTGVAASHAISASFAASSPAPSAADDAFTMAPGAVMFSVGAPGVLVNDVDPHGDALTAMLVDAPSHGTVTLQANGGFSYAPSPGFFGSDVFTYRVTDGASQSNLATVTLTVPPVPLIAVNDLASTMYGTPVTIAVLMNDAGVTGTPPITGVTQGMAGSVAVAANGTVTYTPWSGYSGTDAFTYTVANAGGDTATATVFVQVFSPLTAVSLQANPTAISQAGVPITLTAVPTGGRQVEYQFMVGYYLKNKWKSEVIQAYGPSPTCVWTPSVLRTYYFMVGAREVGHTTAYDCFTRITLLGAATSNGK